MKYGKKLKGEIAELAVATRLTEDSWKVLFPYGEDCRYDLVAEKKGRFFRIQVKYVTPKGGVLSASCRSSNNWSVLHYTKEDFDLLAVYDANSKQTYFIPVDEINRSSFKLRLDKPKNNQIIGVHSADRYTSLAI